VDHYTAIDTAGAGDIGLLILSFPSDTLASFVDDGCVLSDLEPLYASAHDDPLIDMLMQRMWAGAADNPRAAAAASRDICAKRCKEAVAALPTGSAFLAIRSANIALQRRGNARLHRAWPAIASALVLKKWC
jgi:hypothetical protein